MKRIIKNSIQLLLGTFFIIILIAKITGLSTMQIKPMSWIEIQEEIGSIFIMSIVAVIGYLYVEYYEYKKKKGNKK